LEVLALNNQRRCGSMFWC